MNWTLIMNAPLTKEQLALLSSNASNYSSSPIATEAKPALFGMVTSAVRWIVEFPRRQAVLDELGRLTDRELTDIGLIRSELRTVFARQR